tara:strand:+ start:694 stop:1212 length:519 start_codon:yes stop_codon:yes gene_type:complete
MIKNPFGKTLVLDSSYLPRSVISSARAFVIVYKGSADVVEYHPKYFKLANPELKYLKPSIIRIPKYINATYKEPSLNKQNIFKRDSHRCVYCGSGDFRKLTIDHVVPQSKGGKDRWDNLVTACLSCNNEKSDMSAADYGKGIPEPRKPHYLMLLKQISHIPKEWYTYLMISK